MTTTNVLVTGAKAGLGNGVLATYAARPNTLAIAAIREGPNTAEADKLTKLPVGSGSKVIVVKYDAASPSSAQQLASSLQSTHGVTYLDVVIANAGILKQAAPAKDTPHDALNEHIQVNTLGPISLYQATYGLLRAASQPKFFVISSVIGSIEAMETIPVPMLAYGMSKAAVNYFVKKAHMEEDKVTIVSIQPGWVQTNMGHAAADYLGMKHDEVPVTLDHSINSLVKLFDTATKAETSGTFQNVISEDKVPW